MIMDGVIGALRGMSVASVMFRMFLAVVLSGILGLEREQKRHPAGFRTYMLVCIGATSAMLIGQYESVMMNGVWKELAALVGVHADVSRVGAQVINGIGFLGAGTILITEKSEASGMTTAAGLWSTACMGIAIGAGFYECTIVGFLLMIVCFKVLEPIKEKIVAKGRNIGVYCELKHIYDIGNVVSFIKASGIDIRGVEIDKDNDIQKSSALIYLRLPRGMEHTEIISSLSELPCLTVINEIGKE